MGLEVFSHEFVQWAFDLLYAFFADMGISDGCFDATMAKEVLYETNVGSVF